MPETKIDGATVHRIARLARIKIADDESQKLQRELDGILAWVAELDAIDTKKAEPLTSIGPTVLRLRDDDVTDGNCVADILANAPKAEDNFFLVPKVIE